MTQYQLDEQKLLNNFISNFHLKNINQKWKQGSPIELIYNSSNKKNTYCNLIIDNKQNIEDMLLLKNLSFLLDWCINNYIFIPQFNIAYPFLNFIELDIFFNYFSSIPLNILNNTKSITINYFLNDFNISLKNQIENYEKKFKKLNVQINFIINIENPLIFNENDLIFLNEKKYKIQPLITPQNIIHMQQYFDQYLYIIKKYNDIKISNFYIIKTNQWKNLQIEEYKNLIVYIWNIYSKIEFNELIKNINQLNNTIFDICKINWDINSIRCHLNKYFYFNLFDLSIPICNCLISPQFLAGYFNLNSNTIIPCNNLSSYLQIKTLSPNFYPKCMKCIYKHVCTRGCLGEQFFTSGELLLPIENICILEQTRLNTLIDLYINTGILDYQLNNNLINNKFLEEWFILIKKNKDLNK